METSTMISLTSLMVNGIVLGVGARVLYAGKYFGRQEKTIEDTNKNLALHIDECGRGYRRLQDEELKKVDELNCEMRRGTCELRLTALEKHMATANDEREHSARNVLNAALLNILTPREVIETRFKTIDNRLDKLENKFDDVQKDVKEILRVAKNGNK